MFSILPVNSDSGHYKFTTELDNTSYIFEIRYNNRASRWVMSMSESDETPIFSGLYLVVGVDYFSLFRNDVIPSGLLILINEANEGAVPTRDNLGIDCFLVYVDG